MPNSGNWSAKFSKVFCGLKAHEPKAQGFSPVSADRTRGSDMKGRKKFSEITSDLITARDLSGRTFGYLLDHRAEALCFVLLGLQPTRTEM